MIRLDSFSKVVSSGLRLGFITAPAPLIASIELHLQSSHLHAPTLSQVGRVAFFHPVKLPDVLRRWYSPQTRTAANTFFRNSTFTLDCDLIEDG